MSLNSIKTLALAISLLGVVACGGKGTGQKNNLKIDGLYKVDKLKG